MHLLELENLKRYYGRLLALDAPDVALPPGAVGLLGPNGAGKSTLLKILLGLLRPSSGRARVLGMDAVARSVEIRALVGYVSEGDSSVPGLTAVEFVGLAGEVAGMRWKDAHRRAHEVLAALGVEDSRYRNVETLPTGVKQRVELAQALVHDPKVLILDEPTNGLDPAGRRAMLDLVSRLHRDFGKSVILSSHLLDDVGQVCDSLVILDRGKVLAHGRIDVLRAHVRNRYRLKLVGDADGFLGALTAEGARARDETRPGAEEREYSVEVPEGFRPGRFFEVLRGGGPAIAADHPAARGRFGPVILKGLVPEEEDLGDLFKRIVETGEESVAREAGV